MAFIETAYLTKVYRTNRKDPGIGGAVKALFQPQFVDKLAVDRINLQVEAGEAMGYQVWKVGLRHYAGIGP